MCKTIRRVKKVSHTIDRGFTHARVGPDGWAFRALKRVPLPDSEYKKKWWRFHRDHNIGFNGSNKLYRSSWGGVRTQNRNNLVNWTRNEDVDCFFWEDINTKEWR